MIHACPARLWYVDRILIPDMEAQGVDRAEISVWNDIDQRGNLLSCVESMALCGRIPGGIWHLQDDVLIAPDFAEKTAPEPAGVTCGFCFPSEHPAINFQGGNIPVLFMWYSFQCIYIPNALAGEFAAWFYSKAQFREAYRERIDEGKHDDWFFREFMLEEHPSARVANLSPNLVEHVDYLIGGTIINHERKRPSSRAVHMESDALVAALETRLAAMQTSKPRRRPDEADTRK